MQAVEFLTRAGEESLNKYALDQSHAYFKQAFEILSAPEKTKGNEKLLIDLIINLGKVHDRLANYTQLISLFKAHITLAESHGTKEQLMMFYGRLGYALSMREIPVEGHYYLQKGLFLAEERNDVEAIGYHCSWLTLNCAYMGLLDQAALHGKRAREAADCHYSDKHLVRTAYFLSLYAHFFRGDVKKTAELSEALLEYGRKHSDVRSIARHYAGMGWSCISAGDFLPAIEFFEKCIQVSLEPMISHVAKIMIGTCYLCINETKAAQDIFKDIVEHGNKPGHEFVESITRAIKGAVLISQGDLKQGIAVSESALALHLENKSIWLYAYGNYSMGRIYSRIAQVGAEDKGFSFTAKNIGYLIKTILFANCRAEEHLELAITISREIGAKSVLGQAYLELSQIQRTRGKLAKARGSIVKAIEAFEMCQADLFLKKAREDLAALS